MSSIFCDCHFFYVLRKYGKRSFSAEDVFGDKFRKSILPNKLGIVVPTCWHAQLVQIFPHSFPPDNFVSTCSNSRESQPACNGFEPEIYDVKTSKFS